MSRDRGSLSRRRNRFSAAFHEVHERVTPYAAAAVLTRYSPPQYVVIAAGGHGTLGTTFGDHIVAFALPQTGSR